MPVERVIAINGSGGAGVDILATIHCSRVEVKEDGAVVSQGLTYLDPYDNFTATKTAPPIVGPSDEQIIIGNEAAMHSGGHVIIGKPAQMIVGQAIPATKLLGQIKSKSATATSIRVREIE